MTKRMRSGWYVCASVDHWRNYLLGPFPNARPAVDMIEPVRRCAQLSDDPRFKQAQYGVTKKRSPLPPGSLKLDHNYVRETLAVRSWASVFSDKRQTAGGWVDKGDRHDEIQSLIDSAQPIEQVMARIP